MNLSSKRCVTSTPDGNLPGGHTDSNCICCHICDDTAPGVFRTADDGDVNIVHTQPVTAEEIALAREAMEGCPVEAIGDDGCD